MHLSPNIGYTEQRGFTLGIHDDKTSSIGLSPKPLVETLIRTRVPIKPAKTHIFQGLCVRRLGWFGRLEQENRKEFCGGNIIYIHK
jgi:hypothetical protein